MATKLKSPGTSDYYYRKEGDLIYSHPAYKDQTPMAKIVADVDDGYLCIAGWANAESLPPLDVSYYPKSAVLVENKK